jgi:hypothetical protein
MTYEQMTYEQMTYEQMTFVQMTNDLFKLFALLFWGENQE